MNPWRGCRVACLLHAINMKCNHRIISIFHLWRQTIPTMIHWPHYTWFNILQESHIDSSVEYVAFETYMIPSIVLICAQRWCARWLLLRLAQAYSRIVNIKIHIGLYDVAVVMIIQALNKRQSFHVQEIQVSTKYSRWLEKFAIGPSVFFVRYA